MAEEKSKLDKFKDGVKKAVKAMSDQNETNSVSYQIGEGIENFFNNIFGGKK